MSSLTVTTRPRGRTLADLLRELGDIPPERVLRDPAPGQATEKDLLRLLNHENRPCELVDGVLVEKAMGFRESMLALFLGHVLHQFLAQHDLGILTGPDGTIRLAPLLVRIPDVAFFAWRQFPNRQLPRKPIPDLVPDLAAEVLSESNTPAEMERKLGEYFRAGVQLVWLIDPENRTVRVYSAPDSFVVLTDDLSLDGGDVLPGFTLRLRNLFDRVGESDQTTRSDKPRRRKKGR